MIRKTPPGRLPGQSPIIKAIRREHCAADAGLCRHQFADLAEGSVDAEGCLVCPWHQSRYDVRTGEMVEGPRGFLAYHGPTPVYSQLVAALGRLLKLRVRRAVGDGEDVVLE